jgi:hypothetical protein
MLRDVYRRFCPYLEQHNLHVCWSEKVTENIEEENDHFMLCTHVLRLSTFMCVKQQFLD